MYVLVSRRGSQLGGGRTWGPVGVAKFDPQVCLNRKRLWGQQRPCQVPCSSIHWHGGCKSAGEAPRGLHGPFRGRGMVTVRRSPPPQLMDLRWLWLSCFCLSLTGARRWKAGRTKRGAEWAQALVRPISILV